VYGGRLREYTQATMLVTLILSCPVVILVRIQIILRFSITFFSPPPWIIPKIRP
jgi:hypothetical protein